MMKRLLCITTYTGLGGGETSLLTLLDHLDPAQWQPQLLAPREGQLPDAFRTRGWQVHTRPFRGVTTYFIPGIWGRFPIVNRIAAILRDQQIAAIHSDYHSLPYAVRAGAITHTPLIWTCWGWWFHPKFWQRGFFQRPQGAFAASWAIRDGFLGDPPFMPPERLPVLPPGVDTVRFQPGIDGSSVRADASISPDAPLVALIARFQDVKGHDTFQAMARLVAEAIPEARFIVAGENVHGASADDDYKRRILDAHAADPILREKLIYLGFRPDAERVIAAADVIVCSSHFESYGMVNIEAMASAKPVVSTRKGGPSETVVDGETGFLVDPKDPAALADRVIRLLRDPSLRDHMGAAGRARVERLFSARSMAAVFSQTLETLIENR